MGEKRTSSLIREAFHGFGCSFILVGSIAGVLLSLGMSRPLLLARRSLTSGPLRACGLRSFPEDPCATSIKAKVNALDPCFRCHRLFSSTPSFLPDIEDLVGICIRPKPLRTLVSVSQSNSPFELLCGGERRFDIDLKDVRRRFIDLQSQAHPDRAALGVQGLPSATEINNAYQILRCPISRSIQLFEEAFGEPFSREDATDSLQPELLEAVLEQRTAIEEARDHSSLNLIAEKERAAIDIICTSLTECFSPANRGPRKWHSSSVRLLILKLRYHTSVLRAVQARLETLQPV
jgi:Fe-S protein assembly co-chaperone HscB